MGTLRDAYTKSNLRVWAQVKPLCVQAVGSAEVAEKLGGGANDPMNPVEKLFLALTAENKVFEGDLAQSLGPEEAHRLAYGEGLCASTHEFGGPGPRERGSPSAPLAKRMIDDSQSRRPWDV